MISKGTNSNYCFALAIWDRVFVTHRGSPPRGHDALILEPPLYHTTSDGRLLRLLLKPFRYGRVKSRTIAILPNT